MNSNYSATDYTTSAAVLVMHELTAHWGRRAHAVYSMYSGCCTCTPCPGYCQLQGCLSMSMNEIISNPGLQVTGYDIE
jgi:hypothetical protein